MGTIEDFFSFFLGIGIQSMCYMAGLWKKRNKYQYQFEHVELSVAYCYAKSCQWLHHERKIPLQPVVLVSKKAITAPFP